MAEYTIRDATEQDVLDTVLAVKQFCKEIPHPAWGKFDANKVKQLVSNLVEHELGFVKIVVHDEEVVGALIGAISSLPINNITVAQELMFWLDPDHRNGKTSFKLIDQYVEWSKEKGCDYARLSTLDETMGTKAGVLFKRKGFKPTETAYIKEV
jgi:GNAT superfamily N-acetyltransferase